MRNNLTHSRVFTTRRLALYRENNVKNSNYKIYKSYRVCKEQVRKKKKKKSNPIRLEKLLKL